jgi:hypothetical protein
MINDSRNALTDFDMSLALTQIAINSQLEAAWKTWKGRKNIGITIDIFKGRKVKDGPLFDSKYGISVAMGAPRVNLSLEQGLRGQVLVTLPLSSGYIRYQDEFSPSGDSTCKIIDWGVSFVTDIGKEPIDLELLRIIDAEAADAVQQVVSQPGISDSIFSIEYLFLKLTGIDLEAQSNRYFAIPSKTQDEQGNEIDTPVPAIARLKESLGYLLEGDLGKFMIGTVVRRNPQQSVPTFALTDLIFNIHKNLSAPDLGTLDYLGRFGGGKLPENAAQLADDSFKDTWVRPEMVDGTTDLVSGVMAIRRDKFLDGYLIPEFEKYLGNSPDATGLTRTFASSNSKRNSKRTLIDQIIDQNGGYWLTIALQPGSDTLALSGRIYSSIVYTEHTLGPAGMETARLEAAGERTISGTIKLTAQGIAPKFGVKSQLTYAISEFRVTKQEASGFGKVTDAISKIGKLFGGESLLDMLGNFTQSYNEMVTRSLNNALSNVNLDLSQQAFVPPGGGVLTFRDLHFSDKTGDLMFNVIYQAVRSNLQPEVAPAVLEQTPAFAVPLPVR